jgi:xanthine dehydrogenase accessory factor
VLSQPVAHLDALLQTTTFDAALVMSHHLISDASYLATLAESTISYIGLLGPAPRRTAEHRLHGQIGLDIGARVHCVDCERNSSGARGAQRAVVR